LFLVDYMRRPDARGQRFGDEKFHVFPTVPPELYGLSENPAHNWDCLVDLTLIKFVFHAYLKTCEVLNRQTDEADTIASVRDVLAHFPPYPMAESKRGTVFVCAPTEDPEIVYNTPNSVMTVFPGEDHGLHSPPDQFAIAANTYRNHRNEGGNDLVFINLQGARLGLLDLDRFKRQIEYCLLPNGTCTDLAMQVHGRYTDDLPYDFMGRMGIWFENFALPAVINECLLQSYNGELRFFPNWPKDKRAEFRTLRAAGAFLVSAAMENGEVKWIEILCEAGTAVRMINPWKNGARCGDRIFKGKLIELETRTGETLSFLPA
jgi:alpha-L-fucosidase 2